ncbi:MAG TPA: class A beta-lactamase-related serine hydrolase [Caldithrix abyssi]|uniref:Class A beta-lactamase-related serine hydrolase n=1 Tax=Caldithrix abyssi TaxID=187145 RepID=A0A7V1PV45_CALAY|nr:class A beta-lactamase-related serine hydrolase [Caldithrix abyssi]
MNTAKQLQSILERSVDGRNIFGAAFALKKEDFSWAASAGDIAGEQPFFIASTTKLFTTAVILKLRSTGRLSLDDTIGKYLEQAIVNKLHCHKGKDYSAQITIRHLLSHTSGLPDYFLNKGADGRSLKDELLAGKDQYWTFEQAIAKSKAMKPLFVPGSKGKAHYCDTNFQLLGKIVENLSQKSFTEVCREYIFTPLQLENTYMYRDPADNTPIPFYYKDSPLNIPQAMASFGPDGGIVSTTSDMLIFIEAFFSGQLFPAVYQEELTQWNNIFFPLQAGVGIHRLKLPWFFNPTGAIPELLGHSGLSGALAFGHPGKKLYITGTVNQVAYPDKSFKTMIKLVQRALKAGEGQR